MNRDAPVPPPATGEAHPSVLVVDDEPGIRHLMSRALAPFGFRVISCETGEEAMRVAAEASPQLILLDVVLPDMSGIEVMERLREVSDVPVILMTARSSIADKERGFELGADDYVTKPFDIGELIARIEHVLSRARSMHARLIARDVEIDLERRIVRRDGRIVGLTRSEWLLLQALATSPGRRAPARDLLVAVWGEEYAADEEYLRLWIARLQLKLEDAPGHPAGMRFRRARADYP
jgi:two-component system KDP operon response regulator KdpE